MGSPTTIGVDDDFATGEASVSMGSTNDKSTRWVKVENGLLVEVLLRYDRLDHMLLEVSSNLIVGDGLIVLS